MERIAVVIAAYGSERTIRASLERFLREVRGAEIIVVDSEPGWPSAAVAVSFPGVQAICSPQRLLPHDARNRGAEETEASLLLFTDPDIYPRAGAVDELRRVQAERGGAVVAALACYGHGYVDRGLTTRSSTSGCPAPASCGPSSARRQGCS